MDIINNIDKTLRDDLVVEIRKGSKISIAASCFSIYAFQELKSVLKDIDEFRFIFTSPTFVAEKEDKQKREFYIPRLNRELNLHSSEFEVKLRNELSQKAIAKECAEWIQKKAKFRSNKTKEMMSGFANIDNTSYSPLNGFTTVDLGIERGNAAYTIITKIDYPYSSNFLNQFEQIWNDKTKVQDVTDEILENITDAYKENSPEFLYFVTLYNIFTEFLKDLNEDVLPNESTGFKESCIWNKLYNFQKDASLAIINKLEKYNGCILADSVGLGKTFTALSVIKYYENRNKSVLVLCPKKLNNNWISYRSNYINNPIVKDRLRYDVLFHTDLSRTDGESNGLNLAYINWSNYDLVVIDESHNFRNGGKITTDENNENPRENRYLQLLNKVIRKGVKTKVLMLSATPVNNRFNDLKNQLALAYEGDSRNLDKLLNTESSIDDIFRQAQAAYNRWANLPSDKRTTQQLLNSLSFDFFEVLDAVTIARSRKHIEQYYDTADIGTFPKRLKPLSWYHKLTTIDQEINYKKISDKLLELNLAIYTPSDFILPSRRYLYEKQSSNKSISNLTSSGREKGLRKLMSVNMLKRLESSVWAFNITVERILNYLQKTVEKIETVKSREAQNIVVEEEVCDKEFDINDVESVYFGSNKTQISLSDMDYFTWEKLLLKDISVIEEILSMTKRVSPENDYKIQRLFEEIKNKISNPINGNNKKIIIFTAFSDTAEYLYNNIADKILKECGLYTGLVTGDISARSTLKFKQSMDFNKLLTLFSPISKNKESIFPDVKEEIDILIATDCISEGQNLQDCDYLINYDIHWNPVRIIQRFGRIDRIGSKNKVIQLVNYWPDVSLDDYINLKARVESRMKATVLTSTGEDNLLTDEEKGDLDYRKEQLERMKKEVYDLEDINTGVSIMDLGLNEFRLDLLSYIKAHGDLEHTPLGLHAIVKSNEEMPPGVIFVLKNINSTVNIDYKNRLHPFYMVYIQNDGEVLINHLSPKELLDRYRMLCKGKAEPYKELCKDFNSFTKDGKDMSFYSQLLTETISSIINVKEESDIDSFLDGFQGSLFSGEIKGINDFELIDFLVIK